METRWRDLIVLDYEADFPRCSVLEWALYSTGAALYPTIVLGEKGLWGSHRRPGVLEVSQEAYDGALARFASRATDLGFVDGLWARFLTVQDRLIAANERLETPSDNEEHLRFAAQEVVDALSELMAFHVLNWVVPLDELEAYLAEALGSADRGRRCLMSLLVPVTSAHLMDFMEMATAAARDIDAERWDQEKALRLADAIGHLQAPGLAQRPFENSAELESFVKTIAAAGYAAIDGMYEARRRQHRSLAAGVARLLLATDGGREALAEAQAVVRLCRLAAEEEEQRRRLQSRSLRNVRLLDKSGIVALEELRPSVLDNPAAPPPPAQSLLAPGDPAWRWLRAN